MCGLPTTAKKTTKKHNFLDFCVFQKILLLKSGFIVSNLIFRSSRSFWCKFWSSFCISCSSARIKFSFEHCGGTRAPKNLYCIPTVIYQNNWLDLRVNGARENPDFVNQIVQKHRFSAFQRTIDCSLLEANTDMSLGSADVSWTKESNGMLKMCIPCLACQQQAKTKKNQDFCISQTILSMKSVFFHVQIGFSGQAGHFGVLWASVTSFRREI